jgi:hypothetical protein
MAKQSFKNISGATLIGLATLNPIGDITNLDGRYVEVELAQAPKKVLVNEHLPFKLRISNVVLDGYTRKNPAGIGVAIIGHSNYIL